MGVKASESVTVSFTTQTPSTGAATDADSTPSGTFRRNGTNDGAVTVTVTNMATGDYKAAFTMPAGASEGDECELIVSATVGGVTGKAPVWRETCVSKLPGDFNDVSQADITGGAYALDTDANGRTRIVVGTAAGEINSSSGKVPATIAAGDLGANAITTASIADGAITAAKIASSVIALVWNYLTSALTTSGSVGKFILDKLGLIVSTTSITTNLVETDGLIQVFQGGSRTVAASNPITLATTDPADLTGFTPKFGMRKITSESGTASISVVGTLNDAGTANQNMTFELTTAQTLGLALNPDNNNAFQVNPGNAYAYRYTISVTDGSGNCRDLSSGYVSVLPKDSTCSTAS